MPSPKPFGFYGLKLEPETEQAIDNLDLNSLCGLNSITADQVSDDHIDSRYEGIHTRLRCACDRLPTLQKLALIRGLCDRIELKLMEAAQ